MRASLPPSFFLILPSFNSTVLGISGEDFAIIAGDTRLSEGYSIHTRNHPKAYKL